MFWIKVIGTELLLGGLLAMLGGATEDNWKKNHDTAHPLLAFAGLCWVLIPITGIIALWKLF